MSTGGEAAAGSGEGAAPASQPDESLVLSGELLGRLGGTAELEHSLTLDESPVRARGPAGAKRPPKAAGGRRASGGTLRSSRDGSKPRAARARPASASASGALRASTGLNSTVNSSTNDALASRFAELQEQVASLPNSSEAARERSRQLEAAQRQFAKREAELERAVETARREAANEASKAKKAAEAAQRRAVKERTDRSELERRNRELARDKADLLKQLAELQKEQPRDRLRRAEGEQQVTLAASELEEVRRGIAEQETLIAGFQRENERLSKDLKEAKLAVAETASEAEAKVAALERDLMRARDEVQVQRARAEAAGAAREQAGDEAGDEEKRDTTKASGSPAPSSELSNQRVLSAEVERLQVELEAQRQREGDLKFELDRARAARKELEQRYEGIDPRRVVAEDTALAEARDTLARERAAHERQLGELEGKIKWYASNQELITANDEQLKAQKERIAQLEQQLAFYEGESAAAAVAGDKADAKKPMGGRVSGAKVSVGGAGGGAGAKRVKELEARKKELEARVKELERALEERGSSSIASLVAAARPRPEESTEVKRLNQKCAKLAEELESARNESVRKLRSLRQEYDRLRVSYESALSDARKSAAAAEKREADMAKRGGVNATKVRDLERQVEELRRFYSRKCRSLQEQLEEAQKANAEHKDREETRKAKAKEARLAKTIERERQERLARASRDGRPTDKVKVDAPVAAEVADADASAKAQQDTHTGELAEVQDRLAEAAQQLADRDARLLRLEAEAKQLRAVVKAAGSHMVRDPRAASGASNGEALRTSVEVLTLREELAHLAVRYNELAQATARGGGLSAAVQQQQRDGDPSHVEVMAASREAVQRLYMEAVEKAAALRLQHAEEMAGERQAHAAEMRRVVAAADARADEAQRTLAAAQAAERAAPGEATALRERAERAEAALMEANARVESLQRAYEAAAAAARRKEAPGAAELAALQDHVARLETQAARREAQWRGVCDDIKRMTVAEAAVAERRWKLRLEAKNQELERFKGELDAMLVAAEQLQDQLGAQGHIAVGAVAAAAAAQRAQ